MEPARLTQVPTQGWLLTHHHRWAWAAVILTREGLGFTGLSLCRCSNQLTWRDVQHLLVKTSRPAHLKANDWKVNGAGHKGAVAAPIGLGGHRTACPRGPTG